MTDAQPIHPLQGNWAPAAGLWDVSETSLRSQPVGPDGRPTHLGHCEIRYPLRELNRYQADRPAPST